MATHSRKRSLTQSGETDAPNKHHQAVTTISITDPLRRGFHLKLTVCGDQVRVVGHRIPGDTDDDSIVSSRLHRKNRGLDVIVNGQDTRPMFLTLRDAKKACGTQNLELFRKTVNDIIEQNSMFVLREFLTGIIPVIENSLQPNSRRPYYQSLRILILRIRQHVPTEMSARRIQQYWGYYRKPNVMDYGWVRRIFFSMAHRLDFGFYRIFRPVLDRGSQKQFDAFIVRSIKDKKDPRFGQINRKTLTANGWNVQMLKEVFSLSARRECIGGHVWRIVLSFVFGDKLRNVMFIHSLSRYF